MKLHLLAALLTIMALAVSMPSSAVGQTRSDVALLLKVVDYFGETYTAKPSDISNYVFFPGDVIRLRIEVANRGADAVTLMTRAAGPAQSLSFDAPAQVSVSIGSSVRLQSLDGEVAGTWNSQMLLDRNEALVFDAEVRVDPAVPKDYVVNFRTDMRDSAGRPVAPQAPRLQFEIRASANAAAEQARRRASLAIAQGDERTARQSIAALLKANPLSFAAYILAARLAEHIADARGAAEAYQHALDILDAGTDTDYLRWQIDPQAARKRADDLRAYLRKSL
jgi:hypothetical protein